MGPTSIDPNSPSATTYAGSETGARGLTLDLVLEVEGLLVRFGRPTPEGAGLLAELERLRAQLADEWRAAALRVFLLPPERSFDMAALQRDLLTAGSPYPTLSREALWQRAREHNPLKRLMLLAGHSDLARDALARGVLAFLASDRPQARLGGVILPEVPRVVAEALRMAVPRPMSDAVRAGRLLAFTTAVAKADWPLRLAQADPRADWMALGNETILHSDRPDAALTAVGAPARSLDDQARLASLSFGRPDGSALAVCGDWALLNGGAGAPWSGVRRSRLPGLLVQSQVPTTPLSGPSHVSKEDGALWVWPTGSAHPYTALIVLLWRGDAGLAEALAAPSEPTDIDVLHLVLPVGAPVPDLSLVLWQSEENRLVAVAAAPASSAASASGAASGQVTAMLANLPHEPPSVGLSASISARTSER